MYATEDWYVCHQARLAHRTWFGFLCHSCQCLYVPLAIKIGLFHILSNARATRAFYSPRWDKRNWESSQWTSPIKEWTSLSSPSLDNLEFFLSCYFSKHFNSLDTNKDCFAPAVLSIWNCLWDNFPSFLPPLLSEERPGKSKIPIPLDPGFPQKWASSKIFVPKLSISIWLRPKWVVEKKATVG
jgi:hypothetical protein